jgi:hypothetical protein
MGKKSRFWPFLTIFEVKKLKLPKPFGTCLHRTYDYDYIGQKMFVLIDRNFLYCYIYTIRLSN